MITGVETGRTAIVLRGSQVIYTAESSGDLPRRLREIKANISRRLV